MNGILDKLYSAASEDEEFVLLDDILTKECEKYLQRYKDRLSQQEYEAVRDVVFSISYKSKKGAFKIGFKTAIRLILMCRSNAPAI